MEFEDAVTLLGKMHAIFRRKYRTIALLVIVAVLFYLLQCFTVSKLGQLSNQRNRRWSEEDLIRDLANQVNSDLHYKHEDDDQHFFRGRNRVVDAESKFQVEAGDAHFGNDEEELKKELVDKMNVRKDKLHIENNKENKILGGIHINMQNNDKTKHDNLGGMNAIMQIEDRLRNTNLGGMSVDKKNEKLTSCAGELQQTKQVSSDTSEVLAAAHAKLLGVLASEKHLYKADESNMFTCLHAPQVRIPYQQVNDDFCDCPDSSDEPGTSACPNSKFYCTRQLPGTPPQFITSSKVNDGICDCCDGSDEWLGNLVPDFMRIRDGEKLGAVYHAPCSDKCDHILALHHHEEVVRTKGREMQKDYLRQAQELTEDERKRYGPNGVFYALSKHCYKINVHQYEYEVCPFSKVSQQAFPHTPVILGRSSTVTLDKGEHLLIMDGGDNALCPFGRARKSKIYLLCGLEDKLIRVTETEVCEYTFGMSSPAAC